MGWGLKCIYDMTATALLCRNVCSVLTDHAGVGVDVGRAVHELEGVGAELSPVDVVLVVTRQELGEAQPDYLPRQRLEHVNIVNTNNIWRNNKNSSKLVFEI
mgnify:FL=1